jgi:23S rRNA (adenine2503-C2)-methyltransferase
MQALKEALILYCSHPRRQIFAEYVMIKGINDSLEAADQLATYLEGLRARVNLIPYNPQSRGVFMPSDEETVKIFAKRLRERGFQTLLRLAKGQKIMAACGQLGRKSFANLIPNR